MAIRYVEEASKQLNPIYAEQEKALSSQIPSIQKLYNNLVGGLEQQRATETQNILESASQRGVLRSSMPVDLQTDLGRQILQTRGQYDLQRAQDIAGVRTNLANLKLQRTSGIQDLANVLQARNLEERRFAMEQENNRFARASAQAAQQQSSAISGLINSLIGGNQQTGGTSPSLGKINVSGATKQMLQRATNDVLDRINTPNITEDEIKSDYLATAESAKYGNKIDLAKLQLYRAMLPNVFKTPYKWEATGGVKINQPKFAANRPNTPAMNLIQPFMR